MPQITAYNITTTDEAIHSPLLMRPFILPLGHSMIQNPTQPTFLASKPRSRFGLMLLNFKKGVK
jgi:hypothetical protein